MSATPTRDLQRRLGYPFTDLRLLRLALTHSSVGAENYERLEHLGDAVLDLVVTHWLYRDYPHFGPGQMSILRAELVRASSLAALARDLELPWAVRLSRHADARGLRHRTTVLSDVFEAVVGAVFVDAGGLAPVERVLHPLLEPLAYTLMQRDPHFYALQPEELTVESSSGG
jgi:ribonuclease-3